MEIKREEEEKGVEREREKESGVDPRSLSSFFFLVEVEVKVERSSNTLFSFSLRPERDGFLKPLFAFIFPGPNIQPVLILIAPQATNVQPQASQVKRWKNDLFGVLGIVEEGKEKRKKFLKKKQKKTPSGSPFLIAVSPIGASVQPQGFVHAPAGTRALL